MRFSQLLLLSALFLPATLEAQDDSTAVDTARARRADPVSLARVPGRLFRTFRNDNPEHLLGLVPGVVLRWTETGLASASELSIRGGLPGYASTYIDGAPVRFQIVSSLGVGTGSLADATVTTGPPDLSLPDLHDGVIEYTTRSGTEKFAGSFQALTDGAFESGVGYNRFEGGLGGPLPFAGATWFVSGTLIGQESHYIGVGSDNLPAFIPDGVDTTVVVGTENRDLPAFIDQRAYDWGTELRGHAKVVIPVGAASQLSFTGVVNQMQERFFPGPFVINPALYTGARSSGRLFVVSWSTPLGGSLQLGLNASLGSTEEMAGLLEPASQAASADPALGITLETLRFTGEDSIPFPDLEQIVRNVRTNDGMRVPYLNQDQLRNYQGSRGNPYGMETSWTEQGSNGPLAKRWERRAEVRATVDWALGTGNELSVTANVANVNLSRYTATLIQQTFMDVYQADQGRLAISVTDRLTRGPWRADVAVRYDHFGSAGLFPDVPGRIYSHPAFDRSAAIASDAGYNNEVADVMTPGKAHDAFSFRAGVDVDVGARSSARAAIGRWVSPPSLGVVLTNSNSDLDFTTTNDMFGRDVDYGYASMLELGAKSRLSEQLTIDLATYYQTGPQYVSGIVPFDDPANPGDVVNINSVVVSDEGNWGADLALDWRANSWLNARGAYGGRLTMPNAGAVGGGFPGLTVEDYWTHAVAAAVVARPSGGVMDGVEAAALLRVVSGQPYTRLDPSGGSGLLTVRPTLGLGFGGVEPINASRLPWTKTLDLRLSKNFKLGRLDLRGIADLRNAFNIQNILNLYAETGSVENANHRQQTLDVEYANIEREADDNGRLLPNGDINLVPNCASWTVTSGVGGAVVNCVALQRVEARFGNGDGLYSLAERQTTLNTFYDALYGPQTLYGAGRSVRLGIEISW